MYAELLRSESSLTRKLTYFDIGGRAEAIRALLAHAGFMYEDNRITFEHAAELKHSGYAPMGNFPLWEEDGLVTC